MAYWFPVQHLLAANGVASLVFDYSGYGRSSGSIDWRQCELDAVNAFEYLRHLAPSIPISILGFSLGTRRRSRCHRQSDATVPVPLRAFTSFRAAACARLLPRFLSAIVPPIWNSRETLKNCLSPSSSSTGKRIRFFPSRWPPISLRPAVQHAELIVVPNLSHNEPFYKPRLSYWNLIHFLRL